MRTICGKSSWILAREMVGKEGVGRVFGIVPKSEPIVSKGKERRFVEVFCGSSDFPASSKSLVGVKGLGVED